MILEEGQWRVRDLVMGPHTPYRVIASSNTFARTTRSNQSGPRAHAHGGHSGTQWANPRVVPIRVMIDADGHDEAAWLSAVDALEATWLPTGNTGETVELCRNIAGREFVWFGQPTLFEPDPEIAAGGYGWVQLGFECADPRRYSAELQTATTGLPIQSGGLRLPLTAPFAVSGVLSGGRLTLTNSGKTAAPLTLRVDGPAPEPRIVLTGPDGVAQVIDFNLTLAAGQWLDISTTTRLALLNGLPESNQRGRAEWTADAYPLAPGPTTVRFFASDYSPDALLTAQWRHAWM